jgi:CheY-like chemotaxis protein
MASSELPRLILLDLMMPVMDGERFLERMRGDSSALRAAGRAAVG